MRQIKMEPQFYTVKLNRANGEFLTISSETPDAVDLFFLEKRHPPQSPNRIVSVDIAFVNPLPLKKIRKAFDRLSELIENGYTIYKPGRFGTVEREIVHWTTNFLVLDYVRVTNYVPLEERRHDGIVVDVDANQLATLSPGMEETIDKTNRNNFMDYVSIFMKAMRVMTKKVYIPNNRRNARKVVIFMENNNEDADVEWVMRLQSLIKIRDDTQKKLRELKDEFENNMGFLLQRKEKIKLETDEAEEDFSDDEDDGYNPTPEELELQIASEPGRYKCRVRALQRRQELIGLEEAKSKIETEERSERRCNII